MVAKLKSKNVRTGAITELTFNLVIKLIVFQLVKRHCHIFYDAGDGLVFMNNDTFEQVEVPKAMLEWKCNFL